eukprot:13963853-Heterocapsa_arctica.AAC.1
MTSRQRPLLLGRDHTLDFCDTGSSSHMVTEALDFAVTSSNDNQVGLNPGDEDRARVFAERG